MPWVIQAKGTIENVTPFVFAPSIISLINSLKNLTTSTYTRFLSMIRHFFSELVWLINSHDFQKIQFYLVNMFVVNNGTIVRYNKFVSSL